MIAVRFLWLIGTLGLGTLSANQLQAAPPADVMHPTASRTVRAVQNALRQRRYYSGEVDGFVGIATGIAIQKFQVDHSLPATGAIDRSLLVALGITSR